jgi:hypothetical protein
MSVSKLKKITYRSLAKLGFPLYTATATWPHDEEFNQIRAHKVAGIPDDRCYTLFKIAKAAASLEGDIAECGCRAGKSTRFILAGTGIEADKTIHVFDSFEGLSNPTKQDKLTDGNTVWKQGALASSEDQFRNNVQTYEHMVSIHKGWIPERFEDIKNKTFSLVHLDVDLYEPTLDALKFFYERMTPRGIIICDDYGSASCPGAKKALNEFFADKPELILELPTVQALVVKA